MHCAPSDRAARACRAQLVRQHSQLSLPHVSHTTGERRSSLPLLTVGTSRFCSESDAARATSSRDAGWSSDFLGRNVGFLTQGSSAPRPAVRPRLSPAFRSISLILRHGFPRTETASLPERSRLRKRGSVPSSNASDEASGDERSLRTIRGSNTVGVVAGAGNTIAGDCGAACDGEGAGEARGRSEWERARGVCVRLAGVTSLRDRKCIRLRTHVGESVSVTFMLMLCATDGFRSAEPVSLLSVLLFSL